MPGQKLLIRAKKPAFKKSNESKGNGQIATNKSNKHIVKNGENLTLIAEKYGLSVSKLKSLNDLSRGTIFPGQKLKLRSIASLRTHIVKNGENLTLIAKKYGVSVVNLISQNNLNSKGSIFPGQKLVIAAN